VSVFLLVIIQFVRVTWHMLRQDAAFRSLFYVVAFLLATGTIFYWRIERWSLFDSFYFSVITLATVGYGDLTPTRALSKAFTIVYIFVGLGTLLLFINKMAALATDRSLEHPHILPVKRSKAHSQDPKDEPPQAHE
jgi:voltage-gated potassium channel